MVTPTVGAFFNTLGNAPDYPFPGALATGALEQGLVNLPGLVKVSFFQALEAHLQTSSHRPPEDLTDPGLWGHNYLLTQWTGTGWQGAVLPNLDNYFGDPTTTQLYQHSAPSMPSIGFTMPTPIWSAKNCGAPSPTGSTAPPLSPARKWRSNSVCLT